MPEHVAGAVAEEVAGADEAKITRMYAKVGAAGPLAILHRPIVHLPGAGVLPKDGAVPSRLKSPTPTTLKPPGCEACTLAIQWPPGANSQMSVCTLLPVELVHRISVTPSPLKSPTPAIF